jgi:hypothetical protein
MIYPEPKRGMHSQLRKATGTLGFDKSRLSQARTVLRHSRAMAEDVLANRTSLDVALRRVEDEQRDSASIDEKMAELRAKADIADLIVDERLMLEAGITECRLSRWPR